MIVNSFLDSISIDVYREEKIDAVTVGLSEKVKNAYNALVPILNSCTEGVATGQTSYCTAQAALVMEIRNILISQNKDVSQTLLSFEGGLYAEEADIASIFAGFGGNTTYQGYTITYIPPTATTSASVSFKKGADVVKVNSMQELRKQYSQIIGDEISQDISENYDTWSSTVVDDPMWTLIYEALIETVPDFIPIYGEYLELKRAIEAFDGGNYGQSSFHLSMALVGVIGVDKVKDIARVANSMRRAFKVWKLVKKIESLSPSLARGMLDMVKAKNKIGHIFRIADGHLPALQTLIDWAGGQENLLYLVNKTLYDLGHLSNLPLNTPQIKRFILNGIELEAQYNRYLVNGIEKIQVSDFYKITR
jgi:hypothetical protein